MGQLKGFSGWLLLLAIGLWLSPLRTLVNFSKVTDGVDPMCCLGIIHASSVRGSCTRFLIIMQTIVIGLMMKKSWRFVPMFIGMSLYMVVMPLLDIVWGAAVFSTGSGQPFAVIVHAMSTPHVITPWITTMISLGVWMLYVTRSRRVANTFVRGIKIAPALA